MKNNQFTSTFDTFALAGEQIDATIDGFTIIATIAYDHHYHIDDDDCHNTDQSVTGCNDNQHKALLEAREAWFNGRWFYCTIDLSVSKNGIQLDKYAASLSGIECNYPNSDNAYLTEVANELLPEALEAGKKALTETIEALTK